MRKMAAVEDCHEVGPSNTGGMVSRSSNLLAVKESIPRTRVYEP